MYFIWKEFNIIFEYYWCLILLQKLTHDILIKGETEIHEIYNEYYYDIFSFIDQDKFEIIKIVGDFNDDLCEDDERILVVLKKK